MWLLVLVSGLLLFLPTSGVVAQPQQWPYDREERGTEREQQLDEFYARAEISAGEARYQKALEATQQIAALAIELRQRVARTKRLSARDKKDLQHIEKLARKVGDFSGTDLDKMVEGDLMADPGSALGRLAETAEQLSQSMKELTRQMISVEALEQAAEVISLSRFLRRSS